MLKAKDDLIIELRRQLTFAQESNRRKNIELDAMHFVWCDGGCERGVHRWNHTDLTEDIVIEAERNVRRLRAWFNNYKLKTSTTSPQIPSANQTAC